MRKPNDDHFCSYLGKCGARNIFMDSSGRVSNFTSPDFPNNYPPNVECRWSIIAEESQLIFARILEFELEREFDYLNVYGDEDNQDVIALLTGNVKLRTFASVSNVMWMTFSSDNTGNLRGFSMELKQVQPTYIIGKI